MVTLNLTPRDFEIIKEALQKLSRRQNSLGLDLIANMALGGVPETDRLKVEEKLEAFKKEEEQKRIKLEEECIILQGKFLAAKHTSTSEN